MKNVFNVILLTAAIILLDPGTSLLAAPFYVVVGAFTTESDAKQFSRSLERSFENASFSFDQKSKLYYVHVMETSQQAQAENFRNYLRDNVGFRDAWIYTNLLSEDAFTDDGQNDGYVELELFTGGSVLLSSADNSYVSINKRSGENKERKVIVNKPREKTFIFIAETSLGTSIDAQISLLDKKGDVISTFKTGEAVTVGGKQKTQILALECKVAGFNPLIKIINLANPATLDINTNSEGIWEVRFGLQKSKIDQVTLLYNHMFFADAAIFEPTVKKKIEILINVLKDNPAATIVINSHCNESKKRGIKVPGRDKDYFDLDGSEEKAGSDKQLTRERTETLRSYIVEQGIDRDRVEVFSWGSMNLLVKPSARDNHLNDRVEVQLIGG